MSVYHKADPGELIQWVTPESRSSAASNSGLIRIGTQPRTADAWHHDSCRPRGVVTRDFSAIFDRLFDRLPVRISTSDLHHWILRKKIFHIRAYDFGVQFSFNRLWSPLAYGLGGNKHQLGLFFLLEACQRNAAGWSTAVWPVNAKLPLPHRRSSITRPCCSIERSSAKLLVLTCTSKFERSTGSERVDALGLRAVEVLICMITRDFSVISMTSQASLSLSLPLTKVTDAQYRKRFRASYNELVWFFFLWSSCRKYGACQNGSFLFFCKIEKIWNCHF